MFRQPFNANFEINKELTWGMLKYGFCSYFSLAYENKYPSYNRFLAVMEYDHELEKEYLVHFIVIRENDFLDAYGTYANWKDSVKEITDIEFMELRTKEVDQKFIREMIEYDMGFDKILFETIRNFVNVTY